MMFYLGLGIGMFVGCFIGVVLMSMCVMAARGDEHLERIRKDDQ